MIYFQANEGLRKKTFIPQSMLWGKAMTEDKG